jgi:hypothetical protein
MRLRTPFTPVRTAKDRLLEHYVMDGKLEHSRDAKNLASVLSAARVLDGWITLRQAMAYLCVSHVSLGKLIKDGRIRAFKPDYGTHTVLVSLKDTRAVLADAAERAGLFSGCDNPPLAQDKPKKKSKPKSGKR